MAQKNANNTPMFSYAEVLNIICRIAPNATARDIRNAIEAETKTARDNAPQSETHKTAPTASTATEPSPVNNTAPAKKQPKKKATNAVLADAYAKIQAYVSHDGKAQIKILDESYWGNEDIIVLSPAEGVSDRKWNAISLSIRKAVDTLEGYRSITASLVIPSSAWRKAQKAAKKAAK